VVFAVLWAEFEEPVAGAVLETRASYEGLLAVTREVMEDCTERSISDLAAL
jgi:hypothetical protein